MPDIHIREKHDILRNQESGSVRYDLNTNDTINTPQWDFEPDDIYRFNN